MISSLFLKVNSLLGGLKGGVSHKNPPFFLINSKKMWKQPPSFFYKVKCKNKENLSYC